MDTLSHGLWGYATLSHDRRLAWWGALAGAAPDILFFVPSRIDAVVKFGRAGLEAGRDPAIWRANGPPLPPALVEAYHHYYVYTHSLILLAVVAAAVYLAGWRRWTWLAVPYALHILMDVPTHERYLTQPFFPLSSWTLRGVSWTDPRIFIPNIAALVLVFGVIWWRRRRASADERRT
jgi:hypothetical protein